MSTPAVAICDEPAFLGYLTRTSSTVWESLIARSRPIHTPCNLQLEGWCLPRRLYGFCLACPWSDIVGQWNGREAFGRGGSLLEQRT